MVLHLEIYIYEIGKGLRENEYGCFLLIFLTYSPDPQVGLTTRDQQGTLWANVEMPDRSSSGIENCVNSLEIPQPPNSYGFIFTP